MRALRVVRAVPGGSQLRSGRLFQRLRPQRKRFQLNFFCLLAEKLTRASLSVVVCLDGFAVSRFNMSCHPSCKLLILFPSLLRVFVANGQAREAVGKTLSLPLMQW